jgi:hypothetical protein
MPTYFVEVGCGSPLTRRSTSTVSKSVRRIIAINNDSTLPLCTLQPLFAGHPLIHSLMVLPVSLRPKLTEGVNMRRRNENPKSKPVPLYKCPYSLQYRYLLSVGL